MLACHAGVIVASLVTSAAVPDSILNSAVVWRDADFKGELGSMPLGNGDLASNVWIENATGDLLFYIAKSNAFDQNQQPIKVGRLRVSFDPPLWRADVRDAFTQTLNLAGGAVDVSTSAGHRVKIWVDANAPVFRVQASNTKVPFRLTAKLEVYRIKKQKTVLGRSFCNTYYDIPDVVIPSQTGSVGVTWYHRNDYDIANGGKSSFYDWAMQQAGVEPSVMIDPFENLTFGGIMRPVNASAFKQINDTTLATHAKVHAIDLVTTIYAAQTRSIEDWQSSLQALDSKTSPSSKALNAHESWWASFWDRSFVDMPMRAADEDQKKIESQYVYARFLDACDGRDAASAIKFNGQAFTVDLGKGPDARDWGACYWFQNTRQPYYNALATGDLDIMRSLFAFYNKSIPVIEARVAAQFADLTPKVSGGVWPETMTQFGTYNEGDWGCPTPSSGSTGHGDSSNTYIRFHFTGSLELALMTLDDFTMTGDEEVLQDYGLPICSTVLEFFRTRFPNTDSTTGKMDMWPAQALETYQCPDPTSRSKCATNPATDLAGLRAVLTRLLALPKSLLFITPRMRSGWKAQLDSLPDLPRNPDGSIAAVAPGYTLGDGNSENTELYPVHPFRIYGLGKPGLREAQKTYANRLHPCNKGWCQDVIDAAMLNLTDEAAMLVAERARSQSEFRFPGFAGHMQDFEPSLDHFSFMRTAMHYMLLAPLDDENQGVLLFPTWPTATWDVHFKLHAPLNTTIEAECIKGILTKFVVTPPERQAYVQVLNCKKAVREEEESRKEEII